MKFLITGDFVIDRPYSTSNISQEIIDLFKNSDFNIVNLEAPVTESNYKILKTGPHLKASKEATMNNLNALNVKMVTLANNHILDYGEEGVSDTLNFCANMGVQTIGAGKSKNDAAKIVYLETKIGKIAFINFAENEWASATENSGGSNGMDIIDNALSIKNAKDSADFVFAIVHGGHEYYSYPSPRMQKQYRFYIDNGVDIVIGHHPHCISGMEIYKEKPIYYSLGNFLFTRESSYDVWYQGLVLEIELDHEKKVQTRTVFVEQDRSTYGLSLVKGAALDDLEEKFNSFTKTISDDSELRKVWSLFIDEKAKLFNRYWSQLSFIGNRWLRFIYSKLKIGSNNKHAKALFLNLTRCEAHSDLSKEILTRSLK